MELTAYERRVLDYLTRWPGAKSGDVAEALQGRNWRSDARVSAAMNRLQDKGYIDAGNRPVVPAAVLPRVGSEET